MFSLTGPVIRRPSAWRGDATNWMPKRPRSNTTVPSTLTSASQPLHPPALTRRSLSERPNSLRSSPVVIAVRDGTFGARGNAIVAEQAAPEIDREVDRGAAAHGERAGRTRRDARGATVGALRRIEHRPAAKLLGELGGPDVGEPSGAVSLGKTREEDLQHQRSCPQ